MFPGALATPHDPANIDDLPQQWPRRPMWAVAVISPPATTSPTKASSQRVPLVGMRQSPNRSVTFMADPP